METYSYLGEFLKTLKDGRIDFQHKLKSDFTIVAVDGNGKYFQKFIANEENIDSNIKIGSIIFKPGIKRYIS